MITVNDIMRSNSDAANKRDAAVLESAAALFMEFQPHTMTIRSLGHNRRQLRITMVFFAPVGGNLRDISKEITVILYSTYWTGSSDYRYNIKIELPGADDYEEYNCSYGRLCDLLTCYCTNR